MVHDLSFNSTSAVKSPKMRFCTFGDKDHFWEKKNSHNPTSLVYGFHPPGPRFVSYWIN